MKQHVNFSWEIMPQLDLRYCFCEASSGSRPRLLPVLIRESSSLRYGIHSDAVVLYEHSSACILMSEDKVQVLLLTHSGTLAAIRCPCVTVRVL